MQYHHREIEAKWQKYWEENQTFRAENHSDKPKCYVLDMFPYPSGAGLHVGHPLGYIASDIYSRYKRLKGFNVLHPMGYDSFGLPAEQYAIQTGQHPAVTTEVNINGGVDKQGNRIEGYEKQLKKLGLSYDWSREFRTSDPNYYKWTQWIFIQLFNSYYDKDADKAVEIDELIKKFENNGNIGVNAACDDDTTEFEAEEWKQFSEKEKQQILLQYRLTYLAEAEVNWCPGLGTVLANDEVVNGVSERGGFPVIRKKMTQWMMRITAYADRLLNDLEKIDWPEPIKDAQTYWIGKSKGASVHFELKDDSDKKIEVFTTRPDTLFGVSYLCLAPEHPLVMEIVTDDKKESVLKYIEQTSKRSERERMADVNKITGEFTGAYALHPLTKKEIPIWIGDYVLSGYGTGAVMAVPAGDERDFKFASHFNLPIPNIFKGKDAELPYVEKGDFKLINSTDINGLNYKEATEKIIKILDEKGIGKGKVNFRLRDAVFSRQRYWGEPVPAYYKEGVPYMLDDKHLPLLLPEVDEYLPTEAGDPPLGRAKDWAWDTKSGKVVSNELIDHQTVFPLELNTMPGWAGSSWYFLRYMDAENKNEFVSKEALDYWKDVDLYLGGSEHATGHLLYSRFWQKFLFDKKLVPTDEYAKKLINQGMILGMSAFVYRVMNTNQFVSKNLKDDYETVPIHADVNLLKDGGDELDIEKFKAWREEYADAEFILENGKYICGREVEKMSKSKYNVVNPDDICKRYGADTLRMYEMFLGPLEQSKPWNTQGLSGVYSFLKKFWKLYHNGENEEFFLSDEQPSKAEMKILHQAIKKVDEDVNHFSFNTSVSNFMIAVNELTKLSCNKREVLEPLAVLISPYAPHIAEEIWRKAGHDQSISFAEFPVFDAKCLVEDAKEYPVSFNGKMRFKLELPMDLTKEQIHQAVMADPRTQKQLDGKTPKNVIIVPGKVINIVE
ncbi:MAG: leucine--tRNA ligase [Weeksellaceae bacterium]